MRINPEDNYIIPLALELNKKIEKEIYFLKLPSELKEKFTRLEELSRNGAGGRGRFIREKHNLPLNSLKRLFISYIPGVTDMKKVGFNTDDKRWLISIEPIDLELVVKIIRIWIDAFYIEETELDKKRNNDENAKNYAKQLIEQIGIQIFEGCTYKEQVVLFENGKVVDQDAFSLLPMIAINYIIGSTVTVAGRESYWMYSDKNEIVTNPLDYTDVKGEDFVSFVAKFSVQTIPPFNIPYLNIGISSRRWISKNKSEKIPFYKEQKSVYVRMNSNKLQVVHAKYSNNLRKFEWVYADRKSFCGLYGKENVVDFNEIICNPRQYMNGLDENDYYIVFEYGMKDSKKQMHNQDAGISPMDKKEVFENIEQKLTDFSEGTQRAQHKAGNDSIVKSFFNKDFELEIKNDLNEKFKECVDAICENEKMTIEVCYNSGQEELRDLLFEKLKSHFVQTRVEIVKVNLKDLTEALSYDDTKKGNNLEGINLRIRETREYLGKAKNFTASIVIIHQPKYYTIAGKIDERADPKNALRIGFANTGRLTQFITIEEYQKNDMNVKSAILDLYRQIGIHNTLVRTKNKTTLGHKYVVGIYVVNYKKLLNGVDIKPFPLIVMCDLVNHKITVETKFNIVSRVGSRKESVEHISCDYREFPIKFYELLAKIGNNRRMIPSERFLLDWFGSLSPNKQYEVMIVADGTSREIIEGITNKEIKEAYSSEKKYISKLGINGKLGLEIDLEDYDNVDLIRIRVNDEVPDYILDLNDKNKERFIESSGIYKFNSVYYSKDSRPMRESKNDFVNITKLEYNEAFTHRNIIEIYPMYISGKEKELDCIRDVHNLREASIQSTTEKTILPMPLHLAKKLEEYFI